MMKFLNKIQHLSQALIMATLVLSISANCCWRHEFLDLTKNSENDSKHDCCDKKTSSTSSESSKQSCLDCGHELQVVASSPLEIAKLKIIQQNYPEQFYLIGSSQFINYNSQITFGCQNLSNSISLPPNDKLLESLSISPNAPPILI